MQTEQANLLMRILSLIGVSACWLHPSLVEIGGGWSMLEGDCPGSITALQTLQFLCTTVQLYWNFLFSCMRTMSCEKWMHVCVHTSLPVHLSVFSKLLIQFLC